MLKIDIKERDIFGWTPLHYAAVRSDLRVRFESNNTPDKLDQSPNWRNLFHQSPLHLAAAFGSRDLLGDLLKNATFNDPPDAHLSTASLGGMRTLHLAIAGKHQECINLLLGDKEPSVQKKVEADQWGRSPFHIAVQARDLGILNSLLEHPNISTPEDTDIFDKTPLSYLDKRKEEDRVLGGQLLQRWIDFTATDFKQHTFLHHAIKFEQWELIESRLDDQTTGLHSVINNADIKGRCPLHLAVKTDHTEFVEILLKNNGKPSNKDHKGRTPLMIACQATKRPMVKVILKKSQ